MKIIVLAPARIQSGGPELAHQLCCELMRTGYDSYMYYTFANTDVPADEDCAERYVKYGTNHISRHADADCADNIVVVPEELADRCLRFTHAKVVLWWMSVDNFYRGCKSGMDAVDNHVVLHLYQSEYAKRHLLEKGISSDRIMELSDYIDKQYGEFLLPSEYRKNIVLYNPKKGLEEIMPLIRKTELLEWRALIDMTQEEMILAMQLAKVYVDFGNHPGKDRIPREAAACGCCIITNRRGSAAYFEDVSIPDRYRIDTDTVSYDDMAKYLNLVIDEYDVRLADFEQYRQKISKEQIKFQEDVHSFMARMETEESL